MAARKPVIVWWTPGEYEGDLHGFVTVRERDDCGAGKPGPFRRIVRDHHSLGPVPIEALIIRQYLDRGRAQAPQIRPVDSDEAE